jgi:hypothetical protein
VNSVGPFGTASVACYIVKDSNSSVQKRRERNRILFDSAVQSGRPRYNEELGLLSYTHPTRPDRPGGHVAQESLEFAIALAETGESPDMMRRIVEESLRYQDLREDSHTYGNWFWMDYLTEILDPNAVSFMVPNYHYLVVRRRNLLGEDLAGRILEALERAGDALLAHRCQWAYGNIYLLNILSKLQIAELTGSERMRTLGYIDWQEWLSHTDRFGITEFNSTTYTAVQISALEAMTEVPADEVFHRQVHRVLEYYYTETCLHYHPGSGLFAGPKSRRNTVPYSMSMLHTVLYCQLGIHPPEDSPYNANYALTDYVAPSEVLALATKKPLPMDLTLTSRHAGLKRRAWIDESYALSSAHGGQYGASDVLLEVVYGQGKGAGVTSVKGSPNRFEFYSEQDSNIVVGGVRWRFWPEEDLEGIGRSSAPLTKGKIGYGSVYVPHDVRTVEIQCLLAFRRSNPRVLINGRDWNEKPVVLSGSDLLAVSSAGVWIGIRVPSRQRIAIAWEEDAIVARLKARRPHKPPWTVTQPILLVVEDESKTDFAHAMKNSRLSRSTRGDIQRINATWRDRKIGVEVPVKPEYLLDSTSRHLPAARLYDVIQSGSDLSLWSEY